MTTTRIKHDGRPMEENLKKDAQSKRYDNLSHSTCNTADCIDTNKALDRLENHHKNASFILRTIYVALVLKNLNSHKVAPVHPDLYQRFDSNAAQRHWPLRWHSLLLLAMQEENKILKTQEQWRQCRWRYDVFVAQRKRSRVQKLMTNNAKEWYDDCVASGCSWRLAAGAHR